MFLKKNYVFFLLLIFRFTVACGPEETIYDDLRSKALAFGLEAHTELETPKRTKLSDLGELLFYDPILSGEKDTSCGTCHHAKFGFSDGRERSIGVGGIGLGPDRIFTEDAHLRYFGKLEQTSRNSPTVMNLGLIPELYLDTSESGLFWDGRITTIQQQLTAPLRSRDEMRGDASSSFDIVEEVIERLNANEQYKELFQEAFQEENINEITLQHFEEALEAFEKILISPATPYDLYLMGEKAPSEAFENGLELFLDLGCAECHNGITLSDMEFHRSGAPMGPFGRAFHGLCDIGREEVTGNEEDRMSFRTPTLRELKYTEPYTHAGELETLEEVVRLFVSDQNYVREECLDYFNESPTWERSPPKELTDKEVNDLVEFLKSISTTQALEELFPPPTKVPSGLPVD